MLYMAQGIPGGHDLRNSDSALIVTGVFDVARLAVLTSSGYGWAIGALLTLLFAVLARQIRGVTTSGALAGAVSCFVLYVGGGPGAFAALITVFGLA